MSIKELGATDALRLVQHSDGATIAEFGVIEDDTVEETTIEADVSLTVPVYGDPYILYDNPIGAKYTTGSIGLEGTKQAFDDVKDQCVSAGQYKVVRLVVGGDLMIQRDLLKCVITSVTRPRNVVKGDTWIKGELGFMTIP